MENKGKLISISIDGVAFDLSNGQDALCNFHMEQPHPYQDTECDTVHAESDEPRRVPRTKMNKPQ